MADTIIGMDSISVEMKQRLSDSVQKWLDKVPRPHLYLHECKTSKKFIHSKGVKPWMYERIIQCCTEVVR